MPAARPFSPILQLGHPLAQGLVLSWPFVGYGSKPSPESSTYQQAVAAVTGTLGWVGSPYGDALDFGSGGANNFTVTRKAGPANNGVPFTIFCICRPTSNAVCIANYGEVSDSNWNYNIAVLGSGNLGCQSSGGTSPATDLGLAVSLNAWHAVAVSQSGPSARVGFVDGVFSSDTTAMGSNACASGISIGALYVNGVRSTSWDYQGQIAVVHCWSRALSNAELAALYEDPFAMFRRRSWRLKATAVTAQVWPYLDNELCGGLAGMGMGSL